MNFLLLFEKLWCAFPQNQDMPNAYLITLTPGAIMHTINKAKRIIDDLQQQYYKSTHVQKCCYITKIVERGNIIDGMPCYKCDSMIKPYEDAYSKRRSNIVVGIPYYYHVDCLNILYH